jgi:hypothetical protein
MSPTVPWSVFVSGVLRLQQEEIAEAEPLGLPPALVLALEPVPALVFCHSCPFEWLGAL